MNLKEECCAKVAPHAKRWRTYASYAETQKFWERRRDKESATRRINRVDVMRSNTRAFDFFDRDTGNVFATLHPDDTVEIRSVSTISYRYYLSCMLDAEVYSKKPANIRHPVRVLPYSLKSTSGHSWWNGTIPAVIGLKFRHGVCTNPEHAVEIYRTSVPEVRRAWTKMFAPWGALMKVLSKLNTEAIEPRYRGDTSLLLNVLKGEPNSADAESLLAFGMARGRPYYWGNNQELQEIAAKALRYAQKTLREEYYKRHNGWTWGPKKGGEEKS